MITDAGTGADVYTHACAHVCAHVHTHVHTHTVPRLWLHTAHTEADPPAVASPNATHDYTRVYRETLRQHGVRRGMAGKHVGRGVAYIVMACIAMAYIAMAYSYGPYRRGG